MLLPSLCELAAPCWASSPDTARSPQRLYTCQRYPRVWCLCRHVLRREGAVGLRAVVCHCLGDRVANQLAWTPIVDHILQFDILPGHFRVSASLVVWLLTLQSEAVVSIIATQSCDFLVLLILLLVLLPSVFPLRLPPSVVQLLLTLVVRLRALLLLLLCLLFVFVTVFRC